VTQTVAITGGSGFIGSHVIDALLGAGHKVRVLDPVAPHRADAEWVPVDILDTEALTETVRGMDAVFHLAAMADVNHVFERPVDSVTLNVAGTASVLEAARLAGAGRVILASTVWVYAATRGYLVDESTPFDPETDRHLYVSTKVASEMMCRDYLTLYGRPFTVLRYGVPYGPRMRDNCVAAAFFKRAFRGEPLRIDGDGTQERFLVYVEDLARAHVLALSSAAENRTFNLDGDQPVSIREIAESVKDLAGNVTVEFGPARPGDLKARIVKTDRARDELGWVPQVPFDEGMRRTHEWYLQEMASTSTPDDVPVSIVES
jgi:UDP-glucose 4-epimerase